jgi:hypothetical protein
MSAASADVTDVMPCERGCAAPALGAVWVGGRQVYVCGACCDALAAAFTAGRRPDLPCRRYEERVHADG